MSSSDYRSPNYNWVFKSQFSSARAQAPAMGAARQSSSTEETPKEGPTIYHGRDVPGERIISHTIEHTHYRFPQEPPILFTFRDQVGIPVSILLFGPGRNAPIGGKGILPFPGYSPSAGVPVKGCVSSLSFLCLVGEESDSDMFCGAVEYDNGGESEHEVCAYEDARETGGTQRRRRPCALSRREVHPYHPKHRPTNRKHQSRPLELWRESDQPVWRFTARRARALSE
ncbi:hypothetical protein BC629DRAFT_1489154 [Irpex lacteus]|nr:hypothetical protein BC629DRAFT_1489154 [Irpex lacteus]